MSNILNNSNELIVLEMANNHQGDLQHAKKIINEFSKFVDKNKETFWLDDLSFYAHTDSKYYLKK